MVSALIESGAAVNLKTRIGSLSLSLALSLSLSLSLSVSFSEAQSGAERY